MTRTPANPAAADVATPATTTSDTRTINRITEYFAKSFDDDDRIRKREEQTKGRVAQLCPSRFARRFVRRPLSK